MRTIATLCLASFSALVATAPSGLAELPKGRLLIDFNSPSPSTKDGRMRSVVESEVNDPVLEEITADQVVNIPAGETEQRTNFEGEYTKERGVGFRESRKLQHRYRGAHLSPLLVDEALLIGATSATLLLDLPKGRYRITTYHHDVRWPSKGTLDVYVGGEIVGTLKHASTGRTAKGDAIARLRFEAEAEAGESLAIIFQLHTDDTEGRPSFPINGIYVEPLN